MKLIVGLGNPGDQYNKSRHNTGFIVIDEICKTNNLSMQLNNKFQAKIAEYKKGMILAKPQTFMNLSGEAISKIANFYKILPEDIIIVHDDLDLELGRLKIQKGGGTAGHNGLESIVKSLGTSEFIRFRVGIGRPLEVQSEKTIDIRNFVLEKFSADEWTIVEKTIDKTVEAIEYYLENDLEKAMNKYN